MTESYVTSIANGNSLRSKTSLVLNQAGDHPHNPMLRGLGISVFLKLTPNIAAFEAKIGDDTPPNTSLVFTSVGQYLYRLRAAVGYGQLMLARDYADPVQHFIGFTLIGPSHTVGYEKQFWAQEDPLIELGFCAGSAAQSAWLARVGESYYKDDLPPYGYGLRFDPGAPDVVGVSAEASGSPHFVEAGPDKQPLEFAVYNPNQVYPLSIPIRLMENWKDEFDQKHFGGAKYVSVFEEGLAEDQQGTYIDNEYQTDIETLDAISVLVADVDHEYRIVFRFRSELNDEYYVDKLIRFRVLTADILNRQFVNDVDEDDTPDITYDASADEYHWSGMDTFVANFSILSAVVQVDMTVVSLPIDDATAFDPLFVDLASLINGGEIVIRFQRTDGAATIENIVETYRCTPSGGVPAFEKALFRRFIHSRYAWFEPEFAVRLIEPTAPGSIFMEFINNQTKYKQAIAFTDKGSLSIPLPVRNGQRHDISSLVDTDPVTGHVDHASVGLLLQTEQTSRLLEVNPVPQLPLVRAAYPAFTDLPLPTITADYPDFTYSFPATTPAGELYGFEMPDSLGAFANSFNYWGRLGGGREADVGIPSGSVLVAGGLYGVCHPSEATVFIHYRIRFKSGPDNGSICDIFMEVPAWLGYSGTPDTGLHPGDLQVIFYNTQLVVVQKPTNLYRFSITGNLGGPAWFNGQDALSNQWYSIAHLADALTPSIVLNYETVSGLVVTNHGPYTIPRFNAIPMTVRAQLNIPGEKWSTGRLTDGTWTLPKAKIDYIDKTIQFDYSDRDTDWVRYEVRNPMSGKDALIFDHQPPLFLEEDISRIFRDDDPYRINVGQYILVTFLHVDGPHVCGLYRVDNQWQEPLQLNDLRGQL